MHTEEQERTDALLSSLFEALPVGILAEDSSRHVLAVNRQFIELFELSPDAADVIGVDCARMARDASGMFADSEGFVERTDETVESGEAVKNEEWVFVEKRAHVRAHVSTDRTAGRSRTPLDVSGYHRIERVPRDVEGA